MLHKPEVHGRTPLYDGLVELVDLPPHVVAHLGVANEDRNQQAEVDEGQHEPDEEEVVVEGAEGPAPFLEVDRVVEHAIGHGQQAGYGFEVGDDLYQRDSWHFGQAGEYDRNEIGIRNGNGRYIDQSHGERGEVRIRADSIFLVEDEETDDGDDGQRHEDFDHIDDDVLVNGYLDDYLVPGQHAEADVLAALLFVLQQKRELLECAGNGLRERRIEQVQIIPDAEVPLGIVVGEALVPEDVFEVRMQNELVISDDVLSVVSAIVPVDLEVSVDLLGRDLISGGEVVELAERVVERLKRVVVVGVYTGEVQFNLLSLVLHFQRGDCDDYFETIETEGCEETAIGVVNFSPESLQYAITEYLLLFIMRDLDVPSLVLNAPLRILRAAVFLLMQRQKQRHVSIEIQPQRQPPSFLPVTVEDLLEECIVAYLQMQVAVDDSTALLEVDVSEVFDVETHQSWKIVLDFSFCLLQGLTRQVVAVLVLDQPEVLGHYVGVGEDQSLLSDVLHASDNAPRKEAALEQPVE